MTIREYMQETAKLYEQFEQEAQKTDPINLLRLFDAIENRESYIWMFLQNGFKEDDVIPPPVNRLIWPKFQ